MNAKTVNYTSEQTAELVAAYVAAPVKATVEAFAVKFGKNAKSIVAKLSREGVYKSAEATAKDGSAVISKEELATQIGNYLGMDENNASSLAKANKQALKMVLDAINMKAAGSPDAVGIDE